MPPAHIPDTDTSQIVKLKGSSKRANGTVIISAHQDSTNMFPFFPAPGADDDGTCASLCAAAM